MSLRRKQYDNAMSGHVLMLILLGKNRLNQADKVESSVEERPTTQVTYIARWAGSHSGDLPSAAEHGLRVWREKSRQLAGGRKWISTTDLFLPAGPAYSPSRTRGSIQA